MQSNIVAFCLALWLFGWIEVIWVLVMLPALVPASQRGITRSSGSCGVSHGKMMNHSSAAVARARMIAHASLLVTPPGRCRQSHRYMWCLPLVLLLRLECLIPGLE